MDLEERKARMKRLRVSIRKQHVFRWVKSYLQARTGQETKEFKDAPLLEPFVPANKSQSAGA